MNEEVDPPWVRFPEYPPGHFFWREEGEIWFFHVWEPFWKALSKKEQEAYLKKYDVPHQWKHFYFDSDFQNWVDTVDD